MSERGPRNMQEAQKKKKHRCFACKKKIPVAFQNIPCKCGNCYCQLHRLPESHDCQFSARKEHLESRETKIKAMKCVNVKVISI